MAMEKGNEWWRQRSKHGRGLIFSSPELMWEAACEYFAHTDLRTDVTSTEIGWFQGQMTKEIIAKKVPYTWEGMCLYFGCALSYFRTRKSELKKRVKEGINDETDDDFLTVIELIEHTIFSQQYNEVQAGNFREGLTARYLKIQENTQHSTPNTDEQPNDAKEFKVTLKLD